MVSCQHRVDLPRCCSRIALWKLDNRNIVQTLVGASDVCSSTRVCEVIFHGAMFDGVLSGVFLLVEGNAFPPSTVGSHGKGCTFWSVRSSAYLF